jgi:hypothetical protein
MNTTTPAKGVFPEARYSKATSALPLAGITLA